MGLMLFVPQTVTLLLLLPYMSRRAAFAISYVLIALVFLTVSFRLFQPKPLAITEESYADMQQLETRIGEPAHTLVFARHGLEWWVAWELRVKIASAYLEVNQEMLNKYDQIFYLLQTEGENLIYPGKSSIFIKPVVPDDAVLVYDSQYFEMYALRPGG